MKNKPKLRINIECIKVDLKVEKPVIHRKSENYLRHMFNNDNISRRESSQNTNDSNTNNKIPR